MNRTRVTKFVACLLYITLALAGTAPASAQFRARTNYGCPPAVVHQAPAYHAPAYYSAYKEYVPFALPVAVSPDYYFSTSQHFRDSLLADAIVGRLLQQQGQQLQQPTATLPQRLPATQPQQQPQAAPQPVPPTPAPQPQAQGAQPASAFNPQLFGQIVQQSCIGCHGGSAKRGGFDMTNWAQMDAASRYFVLDRVGSQEMPPREDVAKGKAHPVDDVGFAQFRAWAKQAGRPGK